MNVFGQTGRVRTKLVVFGQSGSIWTKWSFLDKVVLFGQSGPFWTKWFYLDKVVLFGQSGSIWTKWSFLNKVVLFGQSFRIWTAWMFLDKLVAFGQSWSFLDKIGSILYEYNHFVQIRLLCMITRVVVFGQTSCIWRKWSYLNQIDVFDVSVRQSGYIWTKCSYLDKVGGCIWIVCFRRRLGWLVVVWLDVDRLDGAQTYKLFEYELGRPTVENAKGCWLRYCILKPLIPLAKTWKSSMTSPAGRFINSISSVHSFLV